MNQTHPLFRCTRIWLTGVWWGCHLFHNFHRGPLIPYHRHYMRPKKDVWFLEHSLLISSCALRSNMIRKFHDREGLAYHFVILSTGVYWVLNISEGLPLSPCRDWDVEMNKQTSKQTNKQTNKLHTHTHTHTHNLQTISSFFWEISVTGIQEQWLYIIPGVSNKFKEMLSKPNDVRHIGVASKRQGPQRRVLAPPPRPPPPISSKIWEVAHWTRPLSCLSCYMAIPCL